MIHSRLRRGEVVFRLREVAIVCCRPGKRSAPFGSL